MSQDVPSDEESLIGSGFKGDGNYIIINKESHTCLTPPKGSLTKAQGCARNPDDLAQVWGLYRVTYAELFAIENLASKTFLAASSVSPNASVVEMRHEAGRYTLPIKALWVLDYSMYYLEPEPSVLFRNVRYPGFNLNLQGGGQADGTPVDIQPDRGLGDKRETEKWLLRRRFSASPPFNKSPTPGSTRSQSSTPPTPSQVRRKLEIDERCRRQFSRPARQLSVQTAEQHGSFFRLFDAQPKLKHRLPPDTDYWLLAREIVKKHWREQGIWCYKWDKETNVSLWRWKHEESETAAAGAKRPPCRPAHREKLEQDREASRPFQQFLWQLVRQRDFLTSKLNGALAVDVNTVAYEAVKERWDRMGIWDPEWGVMPGMSWMHERPPAWTPQDISKGAHAEEYSFPVAEVEAEAQRLFPKRPSPVTISERNGVTEPLDDRGLFDAASCSELVNDNANKETGDAGLPSGYTINGTSDVDSELATSPRVLEEPGPPHPLDDDAEYQRQVARLMDPFNVLKRKMTPQDISSTRQSPKADTPHEVFHRSNVQERLAYNASTSACVTQGAGLAGNNFDNIGLDKKYCWSL